MRKNISTNDRLGVYNKCDGHCCYCGKSISFEKFHIDHFYPIWNQVTTQNIFGIDVHDSINLMPSCGSCNHYKRGDMPEEFRKKIQSIHERIIKQYITKVGIDFGIIVIKPFNGMFYFESNPQPSVKHPLPLIKE